MAVDLVEGWTGSLEWQLKKDLVVVDLTGMTTCAILKDNDGTLISTTCADAVTYITATCGHLGFWPNPTTFTHANQPYQIRFKVTDTLGYIVYFPSGAAETLTVHSQ